MSQWVWTRHSYFTIKGLDEQAHYVSLLGEMTFVYPRPVLPFSLRIPYLLCHAKKYIMAANG